MPSPADGPTSLRVEVVEAPEGLARHADAWRALLARSDSNQATLSPDWLLPWWTIFGARGGRRLVACLFWDASELVGLAPLLGRWHVSPAGIPFARLELLGTGEPEEHEIASDYVGIIAARAHEEKVAAAFAAMAAGRAGAGAGGALPRWDELVLTALDGSISFPEHLRAALGREGLTATLQLDPGASYIQLPSRFDDYLAALPGEGRYFVRRSMRDFEAWAGKDVRFHQVEGPGDLERGLRVLMALHSERWSARNHAGVFASPLFRGFHETVMPALLARGALDLRWVTVRDVPVAAAYNLIWNNRVQFYQGGRAMDLPKGVRPGIALHVHAIRAAIDAGRAEYDFLAGQSQYKRQMATARRPLARLSVRRSGVRRQLDDVATATVRALRGWRDRWREAKTGRPPRSL